ncbi:MAG: NAD(P)-binding domain-containing protein [Myxococcales bacterium]|nr:NAD(P)-binding domain-containing protein [Myxococcales bacterium]
MSAWAVIGDGPWGDALARRLAAADHTVLLVGDKASRRKQPAGIEHGTDAAAALAGAERVILALSADTLDDRLAALARHLQGNHRFATITPGLTPSGARPGEAIVAATAVRQVAVIAGAASAEAVRKGQPAALVVGSAFTTWAEELQAALASDRLRVYTERDHAGVELANALAAVLGVALGAARALGVGAATEATALTRAVAEMDRLVTGLGGNAGTAYGLAGLGVLTELVFAADGDSFRAGALLAAGDAAGACAAHPDLAGLAERLGARARRHRLRAPLVDTVAALFAGALPAGAALAGLMARSVRAERG